MDITCTLEGRVAVVTGASSGIGAAIAPAGAGRRPGCPVRLRHELAPQGIRVMAVEPGIVDTELRTRIADADVRQRLADTRERIEWLTPADIAEVIVFAVSRPARVSLPEVPVLPAGQTH